MALEKKSVYSESGDRDQDEKLLQPFIHLRQVRSEHPRVKLAVAMNHWLKVSDEKLQAILDLLHMMYKAAVLLDDIEDSSPRRGGIVVAHSIFGIASTINAAGYALFIALERVLALNHPNAAQVFTDEVLQLHRGQGIEIYWRDNYICPSEAEYRNMAVQKLGALFNLDVKLMQLFSQCKNDFSKLIGILGVYFQIRDDYGSLCMQEHHNSQRFCEDISEGKFGFPIIHAIQSRPEDKAVMNILSQRTNDVEVKKYCLTLLEKFGSFAYTKTVLEDLDRKARDEVERLGGNPLLIQVLDDYLDWR